MIPETALVPLGAGPVATVHLVAVPPGGRTIALKVYPQAIDRRTLAELAHEHERLARLRSVSSILLVEGVDELPDGRTGLRMEYCPQSLLDRVATGPLPIGEVLELGVVLASVLADAHAVGLVHGGVVPTNVLHRAAGQPVLGDFGLGLRQRFPRDATYAAAYVAPEVLRDSEPGSAADVYGLGAVLHLALTGRSPFPTRAGEASGDVVLRVLREPAPEVMGDDVPTGLAELLARMLAKAPADRPDAAAVAGALQALLTPAGSGSADEVDFDDFRDELAAARSTTVAPPVQSPAPLPVAGRATKKSRRPGRGVIIGLAAAASLAALLPVFLSPGGGSRSQPVQPAPSTPVATSASPPAPTPSAPPAPPAVQLLLDPPEDHGTYVVLRWRSTRPLTYAVRSAQQGGKAPQTRYKGSGTTLSVPVSRGLKYCFEVYGTDGFATYESAPKAIRGATCSS